jgi:predicted neuraminidase
MRAADGIERLQIPAPDGDTTCHWPSVALLPDDRVMCVYSGKEAMPSGKISLFASYSSDHGLTWDAPQRLLNTPDGHDYDPSIVVIGRRVIVSATTTPLNENAITTSRTMAVASNDGGHTWSRPYQIPMGRRYTSGKVNNGITLPDGTALWGYTWEKNLETRERLAREGEMEEINAVLISYDEGRTWASSRSVGLAARRPPEASDAINGLCEPALALCSDGSIFMLCRTGLDRLYECRSADNGRTWSDAKPTSLTSHDSPAALCDFRDERNGVMVVWNNSPKNRWPLCAAASFDDCRSWTQPREVAHIPGVESSYPGAIQTADGKLIVVYQQRGSRVILGARFDPTWLYEDAESLNRP